MVESIGFVRLDDLSLVVLIIDPVGAFARSGKFNGGMIEDDNHWHAPKGERRLRCRYAR